MKPHSFIPVSYNRTALFPQPVSVFVQPYVSFPTVHNDTDYSCRCWQACPPSAAMQGRHWVCSGHGRDSVWEENHLLWSSTWLESPLPRTEPPETSCIPRHVWGSCLFHASESRWSLLCEVWVSVSVWKCQKNISVHKNYKLLEIYVCVCIFPGSLNMVCTGVSWSKLVCLR